MYDKIISSCESCQKLSEAPVQFKLSIKTEENLVSGEELPIDIMFLEERAVLHVVDRASGLVAATFLDFHGINIEKPTEGIWLAFITTFCFAYTRYL